MEYGHLWMKRAADSSRMCIDILIGNLLVTDTDCTSANRLDKSGLVECVR